MDKILITGAAGFIGSNLANYLLEDENNLVYGIDDFSSSTMSNLYPLLKNNRFELIEHNLTNEINFSADYIYHLSGCGDLSRYFENKYEYTLEIIKTTSNIIEFSKAQGAKLILISSFVDNQEKNKELVEYFSCIQFIENMALYLINTNQLNANIIRLAEVYGQNMQKNDKRFIPNAIVKAFNNEDFSLDFDESLYFTYVKDVVLNLNKIMKTYNKQSIIQLSSQKLYLKSDIIKLIINYIGSNSKLELKSAIQHHPKYSVELSDNYTCETPITNAIKETIDYFKLMYFS